MSVFKSVSPTLGAAMRRAFLAALAARPAAALNATWKFRLSKDPAFNPQPDTPIASLAAGECDFSGYVAGGYALTLAGPVNVGTTTEAEIATNVTIAVAATPFVQNAVTGYWIDDGTDLWMGEAYGDGNAIQMANVGDYIQNDVIIPLNAIQQAA